MDEREDEAPSNLLIFGARDEDRPVLRRLTDSDLDQIYSMIEKYGLPCDS